MFRILRAAAVAAFGLLLLPDASPAQVSLPFSVELRAGYARPTGEWSDTDAIHDAFGYGFNLQAGLVPLVGLYAGWDRYAFDMDLRDEINRPIPDAKATDSGFRVGVQLLLPRSATSRVTAFVSGGATYRQMEFSASDGGTTVGFPSERTLGVEVGTGLDVRLSSLLALTPSISYRRHELEFGAFEELGGARTDVGHLAVDVGLRLGR